MKRLFLQLYFLFFALVFTNLVNAQESMVADEVVEMEVVEEAKLTFSGSADTYFRTNISGGSNDEREGGTMAPATSFANLPGFALGMANIVASYGNSQSGVVADLVFGPRGSDAVFDSPRYSNSASMVNQLYAYWSVSDNVTFTLGNFNTFLGYEVISPTANFNYSTSYMFSYGPFSHTGLKVDVATESGISLMGAILNPTDITEFNPTGDYFLGAQVGYSGFYLNGLFGSDYTQLDLTGGIDLTDDFYLGINTTFTSTDIADDEDGDTDDGFWGAALYAQYAMSENFKIGARYEFFDDRQGNIALTSGIEDTSVHDFTITANYTVGNLTIIPELRLDTASEDIFIDSDGEVGSTLTSFVVAFVYGF